MEIPLIYAGRHETPRRFAVNPADRSVASVPIHEAETDGRFHGLSFEGKNIGMEVPEELLSGYASVSQLILRGRNVLLTTSALIEHPGVISVSLSKMQDPLDSPVTSQVDIQGLVSQGIMSNVIVKVQAFVKRDGIVHLIIVDSKATFVRIELTDNLLPSPEPALVLTSSDYISEDPVKELVNDSELQSNMVCFLSPDAVCVAFSPFVFTVRLDSGTSNVWSETKTIEDMKARSFSIGSFLHHASDLIVGRPQMDLLDMPPTAAMCVASAPGKLLDPTIVFTLHSDASVPNG